MSRRPDPTRPVSLPIEPLSDLSWQRIERRLFAEGAVAASPPAASRPARRRLIAGIAVAAAALALFVWLRPRGQDSPETAGPPSRIQTWESRSAVSIGDVALDVAAHSALLVDRDRAGAVRIVLERGGVHCRVARRAGRPPVVIHAGDARIEVIGTAFAVARIGDSARVDVYEGEVAIVQGGRLARVSAGRSWNGSAQAAVPIEPRTPEPDAPDPDEASGPEPSEAVGGPVPQETSEAEPSEAPAGRAVARPERSPDAPRLRPPRSGSHIVPAPSKPPVVPVVPVVPRSPEDKVRYERAARLEASDPRAALAIYAELARSRGEWAANALYAQGRLELELGHRARAGQLLQTYITRYPRGANAEDARQLLQQLR